MTRLMKQGVGRARAALHVGLLILGVSALGLWLGYLWIQRGDPITWQHREWYCFYSVGHTLLTQGPDTIYWRECSGHFFWLYPPYVLYPYALASLFPPLVIYGLVIVGIVLFTVLSLRLLSASMPEGDHFQTLALFVIGSAALFGTFVTGQHSAILLLAVSGALWALCADRRFVAGLFLGLLGLKPNWALAFVLWLMVSRRWRTLGGMATVGAVMIVSTIPLGVDVWTDYLTAGPHWVGVLLEKGQASYAYPAHKLVTLEAFTRSTLGVFSPSAGEIAWIILEVSAIASAIVVWLRSNDVRQQVAIAVLVAIAANVYVEFYDALVLAVPAAVWWTGADLYPRLSRIAIGTAAAGIWVWQWIWAVSSPGLQWPAPVGGFLAIWIAGETWRALVTEPMSDRNRTRAVPVGGSAG